MQLIAPDILAEARGLSLGVCGTGLGLGLLLWLFGWRWHRFWTVVAVTLGGGLYGLSVGQAIGGQVLVLGLLLAVSAGLLALEIARLFAFAAGGTVVWLAAAALFPDVRELWVFFLAGGLAGVLFYRLWTMAVTSFVGTLVAGHSALVMAEGTTLFDAAAWAGRNPIPLSVAVGLFSLLGLVAQGAQERWRTEGADDIRSRRSLFRRARRPRWARGAKADTALPPDMQKLRDTFSK